MSAFVGTPTDDYSASFSDPSISDQSVSIGPILLEGWEIPEKVTWGGAQRMTVHKMVGGTRTIDVMGPDNAEVAWSGRFLSQDAAFRADQLDLLRKSGSQIDVVFAGRYYSAVISQFTAEQITQYHIQYQISFTILDDESSVQPPPDLPPVILVSNDMVAIAAMPLIAPVLLPAQIATALIPPLLAPLIALQVGTAAVAAVSTAINTAAILTNTVRAAAEGNVAAIATTAIIARNLTGQTTVVGAVNAMQNAAGATLALASAVTMASYLGRAQTNVALQTGGALTAAQQSVIAANNALINPA